MERGYPYKSCDSGRGIRVDPHPWGGAGQGGGARGSALTSLQGSRSP